jgi:hypothetical protein
MSVGRRKPLGGVIVGRSHLRHSVSQPRSTAVRISERSQRNDGAHQLAVWFTRECAPRPRCPARIFRWWSDLGASPCGPAEEGAWPGYRGGRQRWVVAGVLVAMIQLSCSICTAACGHCCVGRSRTAGDWSGDCTSYDLGLRRLPVLTRGDLTSGPLGTCATACPTATSSRNLAAATHPHSRWRTGCVSYRGVCWLVRQGTCTLNQLVIASICT